MCFVRPICLKSSQEGTPEVRLALRSYSNVHLHTELGQMFLLDNNAPWCKEHNFQLKSPGRLLYMYQLHTEFDQLELSFASSSFLVHKDILFLK